MPAVTATRSEQTIDVGRGVSLCAERLGDPDAPTILLVAGLGQQLLSWPDPFCQELAARGFGVVRFDNRDTGRSWHASTAPPKRAQFVTRRFDPEQYDLGDMAQDAAGLIGALDIAPAHVVGVSMGGMIAQTLAARRPERVRSIVSVMSTTGSRRAGWIAPSTLRLLFRPPARTREEAGERAASMFRHIGSQGFPFDEPDVRERAMRAFDRDPKGAAGTGRQMAAILKSGDRSRELGGITVPALVVHGDRDRMVHPSGARATAAAIPNARLETITGMGHDLPVGAWPQLIDLIAGHAAQADRRPAAHPA
jgi:pimeloyl-ACP methyl ester carboxylesterase